MEKRLLKTWSDAKTCDRCRLNGVTTLATHGTTDMRETSPGVIEETKHERFGCDEHRVAPMKFMLSGNCIPWEETCQPTLTS